MKISFFVASLALFVSGCAGSAMLVKSVDSKSMVHYSELKGEQMAPDKIESRVFYLNEGETIPLVIRVKTNIVDTVDEKIALTVKRKTYFMIDIPRGGEGESREKLLKHMKIYVSNDAVHWAPIQSMKALKKMFGWKKGYFSLGFGISKEEGVFANISVGTTGGGQDASSQAPEPAGSGEPAAGQAPGENQPPQAAGVTAEEMRKCEAADDCVPVGCSCDCSGCGGFSSEDIVNKKYEDQWYEDHKCEKMKMCLEVCCQPRVVTCESNVCGSKAGQ